MNAGAFAFVAWSPMLLCCGILSRVCLALVHPNGSVLFAYLSDWTGSVGSSRAIQRVQSGFLWDPVRSARARPRWIGAYLASVTNFKRFTRRLAETIAP